MAIPTQLVLRETDSSDAVVDAVVGCGTNCLKLADFMCAGTARDHKHMEAHPESSRPMMFFIGNSDKRL
jgi:hypothetical protein